MAEKSKSKADREAMFLYGCRSALQKGIRLGNLDLVKTAFDSLWQHPDHRAWVMWRSAVLVVEESIYFAGEFAQCLSESEGLKGDDEERVWRKLLYEMTIAPKAKDARSLLDYKHITEGVDWEIDSAEKLLILAAKTRSPETVAADLSTSFADSAATEEMGLPDVTPYAAGAIETLAYRAQSGGIWRDRANCITGMVVLLSRGLEEEETKEFIASQVSERIKNYSKPETVELPWWCYDYHTRVGMGALAETIPLLKNQIRKRVNRDAVALLWAYMECHDNKDFPGVEGGIEAARDYYYRQVKAGLIKSSLDVSTLKEAAGLWKEIRPVLKKRVEAGLA